MLDTIYSHVSLQAMIWLVAAIPMAGSLAGLALASAYGRSEAPGPRGVASLIGVLAPLGSLLASVVLFFTLSGFEATAPSAITGPLFRWVALPGLSVDIGLKADELSLVMALAISGVAFLTHLYSIGDMWEDEGFLRFFALSNFIVASMLIAVMADNLVLAIAGWGLVGAASCAMAGFRLEDAGSIAKAGRLFASNAIGDACVFAAAFIIFGAMSASQADPASGLFNFETMERNAAFFMPVATAVALLIFGGAITKSAQIPLHVWLSDSASAPTPAFALMNTVTIAALGVYLIVRLNFIFALSHTALVVVAVVGAVSAIAAAAMAIAEKDIRRIMAFSTTSQFGMMYMALGIGAFIGATFHLVAHAIFKCLLILAAGSAIKAASGETDIMAMGGLKRRMPVTGWAFVIAAASLAGIAPLCGFFSMQSILGETFESGHAILWICGFVTLGLSAFYAFRAAGAIFFGESSLSAAKYKRVTEPPMSMVLASMILITFTLAFGFVGVPLCIKGSDWIGVWLGGIIPSEVGRAMAEGACGTWIVLAAVTLLWSAHFAVLGWLIYAQKRDWPARVARRIRPISRLVSRGFYFEEIYSLLFAGPIEWFSRVIVRQGMDRTAIDGIAAGGVARGLGLAAALAQAAQTGVLYHYMLYFLIGAIVIIALVAL